MMFLAEAYVNLKPFHVDERSLRALAVELERRCPLIAATIYGPSVEIGVRIEEGTLRTWVIVSGLLGTILNQIYNDIAIYPQFKEGIRELYRDAKDFGEGVFRVTKTVSNASPDQIYRVERRTKTVGKIRRFTEAIDHFNQNSGKFTEDDYRDYIWYLQTQYRELLLELKDKRDQELFEEAMISAAVPFPANRHGSQGGAGLRLSLLPREYRSDWTDVPMLPALAAPPEPDMPRLGWPTTIVLEDGTRIILDPGGPKLLPSR